MVPSSWWTSSHGSLTCRPLDSDRTGLPNAVTMPISRVGTIVTMLSRKKSAASPSGMKVSLSGRPLGSPSARPPPRTATRETKNVPIATARKKIVVTSVNGILVSLRDQFREATSRQPPARAT
jgi:hypothetical protein